MLLPEVIAGALCLALAGVSVAAIVAGVRSEQQRSAHRLRCRREIARLRTYRIEHGSAVGFVDFHGSVWMRDFDPGDS